MASTTMWTEEQRREISLNAAIEYHEVRAATPEDIIDTARIFLRWIEGLDD